MPVYDSHDHNKLILDPVFDIIVDTVNFPDFDMVNNGQYVRFNSNILEQNLSDGEIPRF